MNSRVFVYGTLKEGFPNFSINAGVRLPCLYITQQRFPLYLVGELHSCWLVNAPGEGMQVSGQVFTLDAAGLEKMHALERIHEPDGYERVQIVVRSTSPESNTDLLVLACVKYPRLIVARL